MGGSIGGSAGVDMVVDAIELLNEACSARGTAMRYVRSTTRGCPDLRASVRFNCLKRLARTTSLPSAGLGLSLRDESRLSVRARILPASRRSPNLLERSESALYEFSRNGSD